MHLSVATTTLGRAVSHCAHCAGTVHTDPSLAFYQTAAGVFAVLLLTGVVGEFRDIRTQLAGSTPIPQTLLRQLARMAAVLIVVMSGEFVALLVLLKAPAPPEQWQQVTVGVCLFVSVPGIPLLALLSLADGKSWELGWIGRVILPVLAFILVAAGVYLVYTSVNRRPAAYAYHVFGTCVAGSCGLNERIRPTIHSRRVGQLQDGDLVEVACQIRGGKVTTPEGATSRIWDRLLNGHYVSDVSIDTPPVGSEIPICPRRNAETRRRR